MFNALKALKFIGPLMSLMQSGGNVDIPTVIGAMLGKASDEEIAQFKLDIIGFIHKLQAAHNANYVITMELAPGGLDLVISVFNRQADGVVVPVKDIYLSQVTREDVISLSSQIPVAE